MTEVAANAYTTQLNGAVSSGATSFVVKQAAPAALQTGTFRVRLENEIAIVTDAGSGLTWSNVTRAAEGTTAASHADNTDVAHVLTDAGLDGVVQAKIDADARMTDQRVPTDGSVTAAKVASSLKPSAGAAAGTEALRALGTGSTQAAAGDDSRLPTTGQKNALAGTAGTPGTGNEYVTKQGQDAHLNDTSAAHAASAISFTPTGSVAATDVQAAIAEVAAEGGGGAVEFRTDVVGNLGATHTSTIGTEQWLTVTGTLNANHVETIAGLAAGKYVLLRFKQDATGGRTLQIDGGGNPAQTVNVNSSANTVTDILIVCASTTDFEIVVLGGNTVDASDTAKGITKLSKAPASATDPIALGSNERGAANGVASLDGSTKVPTAQIPAITAAMVAADVATQAELDAHVNDTSAAHTASAIGVTPAGSMASTDVQAALEEAFTELSGGGGSVTEIVKQPVLAASTANITIPPGGTSLSVDGVTLANGNRVLLKDQTAPAENGIYVVGGVGSSVTLTRATDADAAAEVFDGIQVPVQQGTLNADTTWRLTTDGTVTVGTTALRLTRIQPAYPEPQVSGAASRLWLPTGAKLANMDRAATRFLDTAALTNNNLRVYPLGMLRAGHTLSSLTFFSGTTAANTPTNQWACLVRVSDRKIMAVSPDATTAAWGATTAKTFTFDTPYTPDKDELMWVGLCVVATTVPTLSGNGGHQFAALNDTPVITGNSNSSLTGPLTVGTVINAPTATLGIAYCYAS